MIVYFLRWDIVPGKEEKYEEWVPAAINRTLQIPGVVEFRAYRPMAGESQVVAIYEFPDFDSWELWFNHPVVQGAFSDLFKLCLDVTREIWEPSPYVPDPIRPK